MQYIVILSLILVLCISIYLSSFKQIESFEDTTGPTTGPPSTPPSAATLAEEEKTENYLRQYKNKLDVLKKMLQEYAKDAENNFIKARETNNQTSRKSLATKNNSILETVSILRTIPLMISTFIVHNLPEYTVEVYKTEVTKHLQTIQEARKQIEEKETGDDEDDDEDEDDEEDEDDDEDEDDEEDEDYERVAAQEKAAEAARLAEAEAERIRVEEEIRLKEQAKKEEITNAKQSLFDDASGLFTQIHNTTVDENSITWAFEITNIIIPLMCKISERLKYPSVFFNSNDPNFSVTDYNSRHKTILHGFTAKDVELTPSMSEWQLKFFSASSNGVMLEGKYWLDLSTVKNPLDEMFPPLEDTNKQVITNKNADVIAKYNTTYVPNRGADNAIYRLILIYKELYKLKITLESFKTVPSRYDYKKLISDIESVPDDLEKINELTTIIKTKSIEFIKIINNLETIYKKIGLYAWYVNNPYNWELDYLKTPDIYTIFNNDDMKKRLLCCNVNSKCAIDYQIKILPVNWTFYLRKA